MLISEGAIDWKQACFYFGFLMTVCTRVAKFLPERTLSRFDLVQI